VGAFANITIRTNAGYKSAVVTFLDMESDIAVSTQLESEDGSAVVPRARNSKLSAFYGLGFGAADLTATTSANPSERSSESALRYASELIERAPLEQLLVSSAELRNSRDESHRALHGAVQRCYAQLLVAENAAQDARKIAQGLINDVHGAVQEASKAAENAKAVNSRLASSRAQIDKLEGARKLTFLLRAAQLLTSEIPEHYRELMDLCLDPVSAKEKLLLAVMRYASLLPTFKRLAKESVQFDEALAGVMSAASEVRIDMEARMATGSDALDDLHLPDLIRIRRLLGDSSVELKQAFLRASELNLSSKAPPTAAIEAASSSSLSLATYMVTFSVHAIVPALVSVCETYFEIFEFSGGGMENNEHGSYAAESAEEFIAWLAVVVDSNIGIRIRKALTEPVATIRDDLPGRENRTVDCTEDLTPSYGGPEQASRFVNELNILKAVEFDDSKFESGTSSFRLREILSALCDELGSCFVQTVRNKALGRLCSAADVVLQRDYSGLGSGACIDTDVSGLVRLLLSTQEAVNSLLISSGEAFPLIVGLSAHLLRRTRDTQEQDADDRSSLPSDSRTRGLLCAAVIFNGLSSIRDIYSEAELGRLNFRVIRAQLLHSYGLRLTCDATEALRERVTELGLETDKISSATSSAAGRRAAEILQRGQLDVATVLAGKDGMDVAFGEQLDVLDEGGIAQRLCSVWISLVRNETLLTERAVHSLQVDAALLGIAMQLPGSFDRVVKAAAERCTVDVVALESLEVAERVANSSQ
jgi:hypothetical protein